MDSRCFVFDEAGLVGCTACLRGPRSDEFVTCILLTNIECRPPDNSDAAESIIQQLAEALNSHCGKHLAKFSSHAT